MRCQTFGSGRASRRGFTLVELLVVISIIGMLMALLLPAVQSAREAGRANTCRNNLRNVGLATVNYDLAQKVYPGYNNDLDGWKAAVPANNNDDRSWGFVILPYMDHRAMYDSFVSSDTPNLSITQTIEVFLCPSNPPESGGASMHYVGNVGQWDRFANVQQNGNAPPKVVKPWDYAANGIFHYNGGSNSRHPTPVSSDFVASSDGASLTLLLSENVDAGRWTGIGPNDNSNVTNERWLGFAYHTDDGQPATAIWNGPVGINVQAGRSKEDLPNASAFGYRRPAALHPGGVNVMFCDGHVKFISDSIAYGLFQALMTPRGKALMDSGASGFGAPLAANHAARKQDIDEAAIR